MARARSANGRQQTAKTYKLYTGNHLSSSKRKAERPRKNWIYTIQQDLKSIGMTWEAAEQIAVNREGWRRRVAECVFDTG